MANPVIHGHSSSRYDKPPKTLAELVGKATGANSPANLLTFTEVGKKERAEKLKADGWGRYVPHGETDAGLMWLKSEWEKVFTEVKQLTDKTWKDGQGNTHYQRCASAVLDNKHTGKRLWASVIHLPSGVQDGKHFSDKESHVKAWKGACDGWADYHKKQKDKWDFDGTMYIADWNVDFKVSDWRDRVRDYYPNCHCSWKSPYPGGGTHGDRLIDATWTDFSIDECVLLDKTESSDHRPFGELIRWP